MSNITGADKLQIDRKQTAKSDAAIYYPVVWAEQCGLEYRLAVYLSDLERSS